MSAYSFENIYTQTFTPREYQLELLDSAKKRNTIICSSTSSAKAFIMVKLLQEISHEMRTGKKALFLLDSNNISVLASHIKLLTDLDAYNISNLSNVDPKQIDKNNVILTTIHMCSLLFKESMICMKNIKLIAVECLNGFEEQVIIREFMSHYDSIQEQKPKILSIVSGLLSSEMQADRLEAEIHRLESLLDSTMDTSSEILTLIRLSCRPSEHIIECPLSIPGTLEEEIKIMAERCKEFILDHRFDPSEIYDDELLVEFEAMPDPKQEPLNLLDQFLSTLDDMGPWMADRVAYTMLINIEKLKVKVPYERHFLLLCMTSTVLVSIRAACDTVFQNYTDEERVLKFSTPKVLKFLLVLKQFKPAIVESPNDNKPSEALDLTKKKGRFVRNSRRPYVPRSHNDDNLCALIFVQSRFIVEALFSLLCVMSKSNEDFGWVSASYLVHKIADPVREPNEAEIEHKRQEDVLRKYRNRESNILITTSALEQGCDLPKCNLVILYDLPRSFHSYIYCKARARASDAHFLLFAKHGQVPTLIETLARYNEVENMLMKRCSSLEPDKSEELIADSFSAMCEPYRTQDSIDTNNPMGVLHICNAISLVNRYCAKLPSDIFTRLVPIWHEEQTPNGFVCSIRLPINSPLKETLVSPPMISKLLARRVAAFMLCQLLHKMGELDDSLQPISKENFKPNREDWEQASLEGSDDESSSEQRPGTTKRRQYYYKKMADVLLDCHPEVGKPTYFYKILMTLTCPLPEEQNTRGRKIYPPENSPHGFGILTSKEIPQISAFPIFTRSGEVSIDLRLCSQIVIEESQIERIREFINYTFTSVLRLQKYMMFFSPKESVNSYLIVPTVDVDGFTTVDFEFINLIYRYTKEGVHPVVVAEEQRKSYKFDQEMYRDAVVMPWYRNQDQPQYFYVAEICSNLNPNSEFPGSDYSTFEEYYLRKYNIRIQHKEQYLLDVDHTSARLNFLTPRYVNRKGVALPTSSEATKRAKREKLDQKQILVPELCAIHPFSASLWRKAVCLPCILYRINALLLADQIRQTVAIDVNLGQPKLDPDFKWPTLNFGWSLADVLKRSRLGESLSKNDQQCEMRSKGSVKCKSEEDETIEEEEDEDELEIGMWSNDLVDDNCEPRFASPTNWCGLQQTFEEGSFSDFDDSDDTDSEWGGLKIEFTGDNVAEAVDDSRKTVFDVQLVDHTSIWKQNENVAVADVYKERFRDACSKNKDHIMSSGILIPADSDFVKNTNSTFSPTHSNINKLPEFDFSTLFIKTEDFKSLSMTAREERQEQKKLRNSKFDKHLDLTYHPGPSPNILLQALTMSNANDGINLERLETIGDSFLKYAITTNLYSKYETVHEGKLSHLRSKQVSNLNLYRLGKKKNLGEFMIATKFDPHDNWLPPCFYVPKEFEDALIDSDDSLGDFDDGQDASMTRSVIPYNLVTQHSIPDKSIADCVEALIGAYLIECGPRGALLFMSWLGINVLPKTDDGAFGEIQMPRSPLFNCPQDDHQELLATLLDGYDRFEEQIGYEFRDKSYLLQALTHASYTTNSLTDCYQRLEFLGDAVLDYVITRHLYQDARMHSPGALTDLRSALVNNTIFASLAVRNNFHKYFKNFSPSLNEVIERFVRLQSENDHSLVDELYLGIEAEEGGAEDVEVPKALGDIFESVAGAIFLDSGMSLDAVWEVYYNMMKAEIEQFSNKVPKSPIRELLELEPETAKFSKPEKLADGRRVRVCVEVFGKGVFKGIGRNYRIAKCTAAKCALKNIRKRNADISN